MPPSAATGPLACPTAAPASSGRDSTTGGMLPAPLANSSCGAATLASSSSTRRQVCTRNSAPSAIAGNACRRSGMTEAPICDARSSCAVMGYCARYAMASSVPRRSGPSASRMRLAAMTARSAARLWTSACAAVATGSAAAAAIAAAEAGAGTVTRAVASNCLVISTPLRAATAAAGCGAVRAAPEAGVWTTATEAGGRPACCRVAAGATESGTCWPQLLASPAAGLGRGLAAVLAALELETSRVGRDCIAIGYARGGEVGRCCTAAGCTCGGVALCLAACCADACGCACLLAVLRSPTTDGTMNSGTAKPPSASSLRLRLALASAALRFQPSS